MKTWNTEIIEIECEKFSKEFEALDLDFVKEFKAPGTCESEEESSFEMFKSRPIKEFKQHPRLEIKIDFSAIKGSNFWGNRL